MSTQLSNTMIEEVRSVVSLIPMPLLMIRYSSVAFEPFIHNHQLQHSNTLVVGTHGDLENSCSESQTENNRKLTDMLLLLFQDQLVYYGLKSEVIFPINANKPNNLDQPGMCDDSKQDEDEKCVPPSYKIPIEWFLLILCNLSQLHLCLSNFQLDVHKRKFSVH